MSSKRTSRVVPSKASSANKSFKNIFKPHGAAERVLKFCLDETGGESASLFLRSDDAKSFKLVEAIGSRRNYHCGKTVAIGEGITGYVAETKSPLLVGNVADSDKLSPREDGNSFSSFMSCPVIDASSSVMAVIHITGKRGNQSFSAKDLTKFKKISEECRQRIKRLLDLQHAPPGRTVPSNQPAQMMWAKRDKVEGWEEYHLSILRSLSKHVLVFDNEFKITYSSKESDLIELLGRPQEFGILGRSLLDLPLDIEREVVTEKLYALLSQATPFSLNEIKIKDVTGLRIVNMFFSPFVSMDGILKGGLLIIDDDTENYQIRRRLIDAEKFSFIGSLTAMIAHEVNNPLDGVMRLINLSVEQVEKKERVKEYLGEAQKGLQRIASLVGSLLTFSRKSASLTDEFTPLNRVISEAAAIIKNRNESKLVSLEFELADESPVVKTNDFYQIITNLLSNAFDAVSSEGGQVQVKTEVNSNKLRITAHDNGCGIPQQAQEKIFEPFWTSKKYDKGTGLGLAIVKTIVDRYNGAIALESEENNGTSISLVFAMDKLTTLRANTLCPTENQEKTRTCS